MHLQSIGYFHIFKHNAGALAHRVQRCFSSPCEENLPVDFRLGVSLAKQPRVCPRKIRRYRGDRGIGYRSGHHECALAQLGVYGLGLLVFRLGRHVHTGLLHLFLLSLRRACEQLTCGANTRSRMNPSSSMPAKIFVSVLHFWSSRLRVAKGSL